VSLATQLSQNKKKIPGKGNCLCFHSSKFRFAFSVENFFTDQNANTIDQSDITFQTSNVTGYSKQHRVAGDTVITESKQIIPGKGNCLYFHYRKFRFAFSVQNFFTDQNGKSVNQTAITFQIFSNITGYRKQHRVARDTVVTESKRNIPWKGNCLYFHS